MTLQDNVNKLVETICSKETVLEWGVITQAFETFYSEAGQDLVAIQLIKNAEQRVKRCRQRQFRRRKQSLIRLIRQAEYDSDEFDRHVMLLERLVEPNNTAQYQEIANLEELRTLEQIEDEVAAKIARFDIARESQMSVADARLQYITPIIKKIDDLLAFLPASLTLINLLGKINSHIQMVETYKSLAEDRQFKEILTILADKPSDFFAPLFDEKCNGYGSAQRDQAISWYEQKAYDTAIDRVQKLQQKARTAINMHNPGLAQYFIDQARDILIRSGFSDLLEDLKTYEQETITPLIKRIDYAKNHFYAVYTAKTIYEALEDYKKAIDSDVGWPYFDTISFSPSDNEFAKDQVNPALQARERLFRLLDQFYTTRLAQAEIGSLLKLDIEIMHEHLEFDPKFMDYAGKVLEIAAAQQVLKQRVKANIFITDVTHIRPQNEVNCKYGR